MAFEVLGTTGEVLLSDSVPAVVFWGKVTTNSSGAFTTNAPSFPIVFIHGSNPGVVIAISGTSGNWSVATTSNSTVAYVFCKIPNIAQSTGLGIETFNSNNSLMFSSNYKTLKIVARATLGNSSTQNIDYGSIPENYAISAPYIGFQVISIGCWGAAIKLAVKRNTATSITVFLSSYQDSYQIQNVFKDKTPEQIASQLILFINPQDYE